MGRGRGVSGEVRVCAHVHVFECVSVYTSIRFSARRVRCAQLLLKASCYSLASTRVRQAQAAGSGHEAQSTGQGGRVPHHRAALHVHPSPTRPSGLHIIQSLDLPTNRVCLPFACLPGLQPW